MHVQDQVRFLNMSSSELYDLPEWLGTFAVFKLEVGSFLFTP